MIIVSQGKGIIINFQAISGLGVDYEIERNYGHPAIIAYIRDGHKGPVLGKYDNNSRCREIISDICEQYQRFLNFPGAEGNSVFQMPEE